ncbi:MAG: sensor histidine kinase [Gammaproteobacteria bacterium]
MKVETIVSDRSKLFWVLNVVGWIGFVATSYIGALLYDKPQTYFRLVSAVAVMGFLLSLALRIVCRKLWQRPPAVMAFGALAACYIMALGWRVYSNTLYIEWIESSWQPDSLMDYISGVMSSFYVLMCWTGLYFGIRYYQQLQMQTEQTLRANSAAHEAQLKMLRYQLNPHFLFNTLNAISTLILDRANETANMTVSKLSDFLRYTLDNDPKNQVTLRKELEAIDLYLEIEKVRFGERLTVHREIETAAQDALVPSLILQPLIENAIKYAVTPSVEGGCVRLSAKIRDRNLVLELADSGPGLSTEKTSGSTGVGLLNTRERLRELYADQQSLRLESNNPSGLVATITIPYQTTDHD